MNRMTVECESLKATESELSSTPKELSGKFGNAAGMTTTVCDSNINGKRTADDMMNADEVDFEDETPEEEEKRLKANNQERNRMQKFNSSLNSLRNCIPNHFRLGSRRLSKIRTLRLAINYIAALQDILKKEQSGRPFSTEQTTPYRGQELSARYPYGNSFPCDEILDDVSLEPPSRISLRDIAERGLSSSYGYSPILQTPNIGLNSWQGRSSLGTSGESSDESFCTEQRVYGDSPESLAASAFLDGRSFQNYMSSYGQDPASHPLVNLSQSSQYFNDHNMYGGQHFYGTDKNTDNCDNALSLYSWQNGVQ